MKSVYGFLLALVALEGSSAVKDGPLFSFVPKKQFWNMCHEIVATVDRQNTPGTPLTKDSLLGSSKATCMKVVAKIAKEQSVQLSAVDVMDACEIFEAKMVWAFDNEGDVKLHPGHMLLPGNPIGNDFCGALATTDSAESKTDLLTYVPDDALTNVCQLSVENLESAGGPEFACKAAIKSIMNDHGLSADQVSTPACTDFAKFYTEFKEAGLGGEFCNQVGSQGGWHTAFTKSGVVASSTGNNQTVADLGDFVHRLKEHFASATAAFEAWKGSDDVVSLDEFVKGVDRLQVDPATAEAIYKALDKNGDHRLTLDELQNAVGVTIDEFREIVKSHGLSPDDAFHSADLDRDDKLSKEEFKDLLKKLGIDEKHADELFGTISRGAASISESQFGDAVGVSTHDLADRVRATHDNAEEGFKHFDGNNDGNLDREELKKALKELGIAEKELDPLQKGIDKDGDGMISESEWNDELSMPLSKLRGKLEEAFNGSPEAVGKVFGKLGWDKNHDGKLDHKEFEDGAKSIGISAPVAKDLFAELDTDKDGLVSQEEFYKGLGYTPRETPLKDLRDHFEGDAQRAFDHLDADKDGFLSQDELHREGIDVGHKNSQTEIKDMNNDGKISFEEFEIAFGVDIAALGNLINSMIGNPKIAFDIMDVSKDNKATKEEFITFLTEKLDVDASDAAKLFKAMDVGLSPTAAPASLLRLRNPVDAAADGFLSRAEFYHALNYMEPEMNGPHMRSSVSASAFGTIRPWGKCTAGCAPPGLLPDDAASKAPTQTQLLDKKLKSILVKPVIGLAQKLTA